MSATTKQALTEKRNVVIDYGATDATPAPVMPIDAFKAVIGLVERFESMYAKNPAAFVDLTAQPTLVTGTLPFQIHVFNVTTVGANAQYTFEYVETKPNADA